ncbi:LOB domain-containing protein 24-like [Pyrus x bretschneideri]|uniref:LOB domain-containing protein 24-like n=1 Tax=Pyrus x bretschneideri TaxID=225117 RepID=UPI000510818D|nr:LOB domain-containing protein 24-like [Pyrus x bretschneideri]
MISGRCAACKYLRRRCPSDCVFSPYFPPNNPQRFASVHRIYGASNVAKMLQQLPDHLRAEAADTLCYEAECRIQDLVYGCVKTISQLHHEIHNAECQLAKTRAEIAFINSGGGGGGGQEHQVHQTQEVQSDLSFFPDQTEVEATLFGSSSKATWFI